MKTSKIFTYPLFALGFRPFFLLAGLSALMLMLLWNAMVKGNIAGVAYYPGSSWHAHEMLLGYCVAVIAGFLLTAVRNWTGQETLTGDRLASLCLLWLYGRVVPFYADTFPASLIALIDFIFLPLLAWQVAKPIIHTGNWRNLGFVGLLLLMAGGNALVHAQLLGWLPNSLTTGLQLEVYTITLMILFIAGRIFPFFTERGLPGMLAMRNPQLDVLSIVAALLVFALLLADVAGAWLAAAAVLAVIANLLRVAGWYVLRVWYVPLLWILYTGYAWIIIGFGLVALHAFAWVAADLALHAFTVGGIGLLTLGMMARVALGHTGRALQASNAMAIAFGLLNVAVVLRVLCPLAWQGGLMLFIYVATLLWLAAFALFMVVYAPILIAPRVDGNEG